MATASNKATLLGLPQELRDDIYFYALVMDVNYKAPSWRSPNQDSEAIAGDAPVINRQRLCLPWVALMLTCKSIASELNYMMHHSPLKDDNQLHTYVAQLEVEDQGESILVSDVTWTQLPCRPSQVRRLAVNIKYPRYTRCLATYELYQTLNSFWHCGPRLDRKYPLREGIRLQELCITFRRSEIQHRTEDLALETLYRRFRKETRLLAKEGPLGGLVQVIHLKDGDYGDKTNYSVASRDEGKASELWKRRGGVWGIGQRYKQRGYV